MPVPDVITELLVGPIGLDDRAAFLRVAADGRVADRGGRLDRFFDPVPEPGEMTTDWAWLQSVPIPGRAKTIEISPSRWADILTRGDDDGSCWVLLTEARSPIGTMQAILQHTQELTLQSRDQARLGDALTVLDAVVLVPTTEFRFRVLGRAPSWFTQAMPHAAHDTLDLAAVWTFLESFRPDAEAIWMTDAPGVARSGVWTETTAHGSAPLEATALRTADGGRMLILQRAAERLGDQQRMLQQARELTMQHQTLVREIEKKEILLHCIVHDLGSPLGAIVACLESVEPVLAERADLQQLVQIGLRQSKKQASLIAQVLDVFKADLEDLQRFEAPGDAPDLRQVVLDQAAALAPAARLHQVTLHPRVPDAPVVVSATSGRLERVVANLVENAIRHSGRGTVVEINVTVVDHQARVDVRDEGSGVPPDREATLFDKLQQGPGGGKAGLGLYFCKMMTERWGGSIGYQREAQGACFWFKLRAVQQS